jgi:uncharacterized protein (TIGR02611 family)
MEQAPSAEASRVAGAGAEKVDVVEERGDDVPEDERGAHDDVGTPATEAAASDTMVADREPPARRHRVRTTLEIIRANPTGRIALKIVIAIGGALVVALGAVLIPLPGPGWLIVIAGLAIWAVEFHWAKRLLTFTRHNVRSWSKWVGRQSLPVRLMLGAVGLVFVSVVVWASLKYSLGIDVVARVLAYLATH